MDAMDVTNLPLTPPERNLERTNSEYVDERIDSESKGNEHVSFEEVMTSAFDEVMQTKNGVSSDVLETSNLENAVLLGENIDFDEDVDSLIASVSEKSKILNEELESDKPLLLLNGEEFEVLEEDIPVIECELELSSAKIKDTKSAKNAKEALVEEKKEETEELIETSPKEEDKQIVNLVKEKKEELQKVELKTEEKEESVENVADGIVAQKPKKATKKLNISVEDLRTTSGANVAEAPVASEETQMGNFDGEPSFSDGKNVASSSETASSQKTEMSEGVSGNQFSSILAEQIKANSAELVQRGKIVLRDGNVGEIKLQLKPAHLGVVRINLKMTQDKKMKGEVIVSSKEAYNAFDDSMEELVASFKDAGFDTSGFDLNWKGGKEEIVREDLRDKYFSPEKTELSLREKLNLTENVYMFGQAENINVLA